MTVPTILDAMQDENLFGRHFPGDSWRPWQAFVAALTGQVATLPPDLQSLAAACTGREDLAASPPFNEAWAIAGRRSGKSRVAAAIAAETACFTDWRTVLAPGEVATVAVIAGDRAQARTVFRYVRALISETGLLAGMIVNETAERLELNNRSAVEVFTASSVRVRGYTIACAVLDEIAYWPTDGAADPDTEILAALRPAMATVRGARLIAISSPYARRGELFKAHAKNYGQPGARKLIWQCATRTMNSTVSAETVALALQEDFERGRSEWLGEFRSDLQRLFTHEVIEAAVVPGRHELPRLNASRYSGFCDPSGGSADSMTAAVTHVEGDRILLDAVRERMPPFSPEKVAEELAGFFRSYGISTITGDRYGGEWPREQFRKHGIVYVPSERSKSEIYLEALPLLNAGRVELLDHSRLFAQLVALERRTARGGRDTIDHPPQAKDDIANAVCGAVVRAAVRPPVQIKASDFIIGRPLEARQCSDPCRTGGQPSTGTRMRTGEPPALASVLAQKFAVYSSRLDQESGMGSPRLRALELGEAERAALEALAARRRTAQGLALRARIVLTCAETGSPRLVGERLEIDPDTVGKWRRRFVCTDWRACGTSRAGCAAHGGDARIEA